MKLCNQVLEKIKEDTCKSIENAYNQVQRIEGIKEPANELIQDIVDLFVEAGLDELSEGSSGKLKNSLKNTINGYINRMLMTIDETCCEDITNDIGCITHNEIMDEGNE